MGALNSGSALGAARCCKNNKYLTLRPLAAFKQLQLFLVAVGYSVTTERSFLDSKFTKGIFRIYVGIIDEIR